MFKPGKQTRWALVLAFEAVVYAAGLLVACGVIAGWGRWYSSYSPHRLQTEALLKGHLALSDSPSALAWDLSWSQGGVHQVWGLGVPLWRLPFEAAAKLVGQPGFPDRLALGIAIALVAWLVLRSWLLPILARPAGDHGNETNGGATEWPGARLTFAAAIGMATLLLVFPPFVHLLSTGLRIWEEVLVYYYVYGVALITGLVMLIRAPSWGKYWVLCALAGLGGLLRPTLGAPGAVTTCLAFAWMLYAPEVPGVPSGVGLARRWRSGKLWIGAALFVAGGALLLWTNYARFGNGFEFGHTLNVESGSMLPTLYAIKFGHPFRYEPLDSAARELLGALFQARKFDIDCYSQAGIFPGQSPTFRWRSFRFMTYDWSYAVLILLGWALALRVALKIRSRPAIDAGDDARISTTCAFLGLWSFGTTLLLAVFYLRVCCISARYMMDFAPAFAAGIGVVWLTFSTAAVRGPKRQTALTVVLVGALLAWTGVEISRGLQKRSLSNSVTWDEAAAQAVSATNSVRVPDYAYAEGDDFDRTGIPFNGTGWGATAAAPAVILFVKDPEFIEVEVTGAAGKDLGSPANVRAKIGLEFLKADSRLRTDRGWRIRFSLPGCPCYQHGIQPLFLGFDLNEHEPGSEETAYRLLRVCWRAEKMK